MRKLIFILFVATFMYGCKKTNKNVESTESPDYQAATRYYYTNPDSAYYFAARVLENSHDTVEKAQAYYIMAIRQLNLGDYYAAQEDLISSIKMLDEQNTAHYQTFASDYNTLANITLDLKEYDAAIENYNHAVQYTYAENDKLQVANNIAVAYQKKKEYERAIDILDSAMKEPITDTLLKARLVSNMARTKWLADPKYNALPEFMIALGLRKAVNDASAINSSLTHLSDYYKDSWPDSALYYALKRFEVVETIQNPTDRIEALRQLIELDAPKRKEYAKEYFELEDSLDLARINDRRQFAVVKFEVDKRKAENLSLQQHISKQRLLMYGLIVLAIAIIAGLWSWYQKRRKRQKEEAEREIRESKLKTSQKVHDVVANGLYTIINELEHNENVEKEPLLIRIEGLYEKSRNISYEDAPAEQANYDIQVHQLLTSFANEQTKVIMVGNQEAFWSRITTVQKKELLLILNEMMVNMKKHSGAKNVVVVFKQENGKGLIHYKDDGAGFPADFEFGNGLNNTVSRIKSLNGEINFGKSEKNGVSITLSFPLEANKS